MEDTFKEIYTNNCWKSNESRSGPGSELNRTINIRNDILSLIDNYSISSCIDIPCGDMNFMSLIAYKIPNYSGIDIVDTLINNNCKKYPNLTFRVANILTDKNLTCDLLICRELFFHFEQKDVKKAINNIKNNKVKYLLTTDYEDKEYRNRHISTGSWAHISLQNEPYNFPKPLHKIPEWGMKQTDGWENQYLSLWMVKDIPSYV